MERSARIGDNGISVHDGRDARPEARARQVTQYEMATDDDRGDADEPSHHDGEDDESWDDDESDEDAEDPEADWDDDDWEEEDDDGDEADEADAG